MDMVIATILQLNTFHFVDMKFLTGFLLKLSHLACNVVATSQLGLIQVETSQTMLRCHRDIATGTSMRRIYLRRLCDVSLERK